MMISYEQRLHNNPELVLKEASLYFSHKGDLYQTLQDLSRRLDEAGIPYALIEGLALAQHGFVRMIEDIDILLTPEGLQAFKAQALGHGYVLAFSGAKKHSGPPIPACASKSLPAANIRGMACPSPFLFPTRLELRLK
jgi:hypothetical protein